VFGRIAESVSIAAMATRLIPFLFRTPKVDARPRAAEPARLTVEAGGRTIEITVRRNARARRYTLRLSARGDGASLTIPRRGSLAEAEAFVVRHLDWLAEKLPATAAAAVTAGSVVPVRGVPHRIRPSGALRGTVRTGRDPDGTPVLVVPGAPDHLRRRVEDHLRAIARAELSAAVSRHSATLAVAPRAIRLKDTTSRWGSASTSGTLSFSWRLAMAPPFVLDYLAAHEVAHLREMNHSDRFWTICRRLAPRTDEAQAWLRDNGRALHRAL
jgi:predicted metal-dependent hydrolase